MKYIFIVVLILVFFSTIWYVQNTYIQPKTPIKPTTTVTDIKTPEIPADIKAHIQSKSDKIVLESPAPYSAIDSPVTLKGKARGNWFFEASFPIIVVNWDGLIIGQGIATADDNWMTIDFVPFTAIIDFIADANAYSQNGSIILRKDNPSGLPENDDFLEIPIVFTQ
jgi:hypothetical protein